MVHAHLTQKKNYKSVYEKGFFPDPAEEICYVTLLEDWEIRSDHLTLLNKKLGEGQFGIVKQGLLTTGKGDPEVVAVKTLKGLCKYFIVIRF